MADTLVATDVKSNLDETNAPQGPYWSDKDTGVIVPLSMSLTANISKVLTKMKRLSLDTTSIAIKKNYPLMFLRLMKR